LKLAFNGMLPLPPAEARQFKQQWAAGLVRAEVTATPEAGAKTAQLMNEADGSRRQRYGDAYMTEVQARARRKAFEANEPEMVRIPGKDYEMGKYEISQGQWRAVMGNNPSHFSSCGDNCPVEQVSWNDIQDYLKKLNELTGRNYRLPSESEWKHACDGGSSQDYCGGNDLDALGWYDGNSGGKTHPGGQKQANGYGLYDMSGNVWEWMQDCYDGDCSVRVLRGGSWLNLPTFTRAAFRDRGSPSRRSSFNGFRVVRAARTF